MKIFVKVKTRSKTKKIFKIDNTHFVVSTNALPEKGKANKDIINMLSKYFDKPSSAIQIISGEKSKDKIINIF